MAVPEFAQLEMLAQVDDLMARLAQWGNQTTAWPPLDECRALIRRLLGRVESLRVRLELPLIVATFGGTGTGKSALVNALVGRDCTASGRQRPTTTRPVLIAHPATPVDLLGLPVDTLTVARVDAPMLRDIVLIDCPDPDTTETETRGSNLNRLHQLLPFCDVLIYTTTQQKYRSAKVNAELVQASSGCRLVFVQTCADLDEDIREDWRRQLIDHYSVPDLFFVDSLRALREQQGDRRPSGDFARLQDLLTEQLAASLRTQIRRANLVDLMQAALEHCRGLLARHEAARLALEQALEEEQRRLVADMARRLSNELLESRTLWERRLIAGVTDSWGASPFAVVLRVYNGLGTWIASAGLLRARSSAQVALIGAWQGVRWWQARRQEQQAQSGLETLGALGIDDARLRETQFRLAGLVVAARLDPALVDPGALDEVRESALHVKDQFLGGASARIEEIVQSLSRQWSGAWSRWIYEILLGVLLLHVVWSPAYNFFVAYPFRGAPLIPMDFYIHGAVFLVLLSSVLVMVFARQLRRGLHARIVELADQLAQSRLSCGLFPQLEEICRNVRTQCERLEVLCEATADLRRRIASQSDLGGSLPPPREPPARLPEPSRAVASL